MATRKVPTETEHDPSGQTDPKKFEVPPPMERGDTRTVPVVGANPDAPETEDDTRLEDALTDRNTSSVPEVNTSAFGVHMGSGVPIDEMEAAPEGWDRNVDGSMTPNTVPWVGY